MTKWWCSSGVGTCFAASVEQFAHCCLLNWLPLTSTLLLTAKVVGHENWGNKDKCCKTVSTATTVFEAGNKKLFTSSTEAFILVLWDNNLARWTATGQCCRDNDDCGLKLPDPIPKVPGQPKQPDPLHDAKHTSTDLGQNKYGSFAKDGLECFSEWVNKIKKERSENAKNCCEIETMMLGILQAEKKIDLTKGNKKGKNAGDGATRSKCKMVVIDEEDEEQNAMWPSFVIANFLIDWHSVLTDHAKAA